MKPRVLMVGTYPIRQPIAGGQLRVRALLRHYVAAGFDARYIGVFVKDFYSRWDPGDIPLGRAGERAVRMSPWMGDLICAEQLYQDRSMRRRFEQALVDFKPDVVEIEQAFPYIAVKEILRGLRYRGRLVFSSHNVEHAMKREILDWAGWSPSEIDAAIVKIRDTEQDLARHCDLLIAVSQDDARAHADMGARNTVIVRNGASPKPDDPQRQEHWRRRLRSSGIRRTALFVGSAHPPNWLGFFDMVGGRLGFVPPATRILLAGGVSDYIWENHRRHTVEEATMWRRLLPLGRLSGADLAAIMAIADAIILPMTRGGGSNLKTAEAILSGRRIVGTSHAFRSFEDLTDLPEVQIADHPTDFRQALVAASQTPPVRRSAEDARRASAVLWENCVTGLAEHVAAL